ncbi:Protein of unknown function DUF1285 [Acididesulfobacillus acetoxydans]|uniref:DUF1285 domain-containing protein n=1 Tax=Acididesulfobacillus acetoxydans TaxID=1561005 RepID=A0A8S0W974_9FIRM|nr:DUF1285 domain-containing protein [Acididesulfobacillus acetoxydans]CAA7602379.1 Protein of unknown function DUF1285 [Acididesulfobacillus acetoxydans]CEJ08386.1 Protein of unknown function (DUF1285) [Acididesulfobacillus acetoxydans]
MGDFSGPEVHIDKNGIWYADGVEMVNEEIIKLFASHLTKDDYGKYQINWRNQLYPVSVEDAPFFVQSVSEQVGQPMIQLYDGRKLPLPLGCIVMKENIPYISLFWQYDTKLSRASYCELCKNLIERDGRYFIRYGDNEWLIEEVERDRLERF